MEKRTIFALLLILAVFWISSELFWKNKQQTPVQTPSVTKPAEQTAETIPEETIEPIQTKPEFSDIPATEIISDIEINNEIILEDELMKIVFSNRGGVILKIEFGCPAAAYTFSYLDKDESINILIFSKWATGETPPIEKPV